MEVLGGKKIIGIDIFVPEDLREKIAGHVKLSERIEWIVGSSIEESTIKNVKSIIGNSKSVMVVLDSFHTHDHVLFELNFYSQFISKGNYLI
jgi:cephalosporin hydroxylase